ncbi:hypothetical protein D3C75_994700 [compost metagenome]
MAAGVADGSGVAVASITGIAASLDAVGSASFAVSLLLHAPRIEADRRRLAAVVNNIFLMIYLLS